VQELSDLDYLRAKSAAFEGGDETVADDAESKAKGEEDEEGEDEEEEEDEEDRDAGKEQARAKEKEKEKGGAAAASAKDAVKQVETAEAASPEEAVLRTSRLFVRNLSALATEDALRGLFARFGRVTEVHIPLDPTKRSKCFAHVSFAFAPHAVAAMAALDGTIFQGRLLHILPGKAPPRPPNALENMTDDVAVSACSRARSLSLSHARTRNCSRGERLTRLRDDRTR
jgi:multiple RNA-binding domain-containing protein 1